MKPCIKCGAKDRNKRGRCRPCAAKYIVKWNKANPEKVKAADVKWRNANSEKVKIKQAKWRAENPEKMKALVDKWRASNIEKTKAHRIKYRTSKPEACLIHTHNYRSRKIINGGKLSSNLAEVLYKRQKGKCACCKKPLGDNYHLDHIQPVSRGGANEDWNIQLLRAFCNISKGAKDPVEYMQSKGLLL